MTSHSNGLDGSAVKRRTFILEERGGNRKTSISLEDSFYEAMRKIAQAQNRTIRSLVNEINRDRLARHEPNLSSAVRLFLLNHVQQEAKHHGQSNL
jgi:predicted DNA-binding ribbon-helix-helix protein